MAACVVLLGTVGHAGAQSQTPALTAQLLPGSVALVPGDTVELTLVITNRSALPARVTGLQVRTPARIAVDDVPEPSDIAPIDPNDFARATFDVTAREGLEAGDVTVLIETERGAGAEVQRDFVTATSTIKAGTTSQALDVAFLSFPSKLDDHQSARAVLKIANETPFAFTKVRVRPVDSEDVTLSVAPDQNALAPCQAKGTASDDTVFCLDDIAPGDVVVVPFDVEVDGTVRTGKQTVAAVVTGRTDQAAHDVRVTQIASGEVELSVFGVDALSPFGITSAFVLPGVIAVAAFLLLARYAYPRKSALDDAVDFKDPRTMLFVVPTAVIAYLLIWVVRGKNLTTESGRYELLILFALGVLLGLAAWVAAVVVYYRVAGRKQFTRSDSPDKVLKRLDARDASLDLDVVVVAGSQRRYLSDGPDTSWFVCPIISFSFAPDSEPEDRKDFRDALGRSDIGAIRAAAKSGVVAFRWASTQGVVLVDAAGLQRSAPGPLLNEVLLDDAEGADAEADAVVDA